MRRGEALAAAGLLVPPGIVIGLHIYIGSFNRMLGDDYCSMYIGERLGLLRSIWYWYRSWHGGFSASAADWLLSVFGPGAFPFHTFVFLSAWVLFAAFAASQALRWAGYVSPHPVGSLLLAVLLVFTTLSLSPDIIESLFWWGGVRGYVAPLVLFTLYLAVFFYLQTSAGQRVPLVIQVLLSFGLAFLIGGFSETFTPVFVVLLAAMSVIRGLSFRLEGKYHPFLFWGAGFVGSLLALLAMILAPGNAVRQGYFPAPPNLFTILSVAFTSFQAFMDYIFTSLSQVTALLGSALGSLWLGMTIRRDAPSTPPRLWWTVAILMAGFVLAFGCFPPPVYGTSEPPPERTLVASAFFLILAFLAAGFVVGKWLTYQGKTERVLVPTLLVLTYGLLLFSAYGTAQRLYGMRAVHIEFAQRWDRVDAQIRAAKASGLHEIVIPSLTNWADAAFPTDNPRYWPNVCYSKFYDINIVAPPLQPE